MNLFMALYFGFDPEVISNSFSIFTLVGDSVIAKRVYRGCVISVASRQTLVDLLELHMVDLNVILRMDWLHSSYASLDGRTHKVIFRFLSESIIKWEGGSLAPRGGSFTILEIKDYSPK